jgi:hypothetical protein
VRRKWRRLTRGARRRSKRIAPRSSLRSAFSRANSKRRAAHRCGHAAVEPAARQAICGDCIGGRALVAFGEMGSHARPGRTRTEHLAGVAPGEGRKSPAAKECGRPGVFAGAFIGGKQDCMLMEHRQPASRMLSRRDFASARFFGPAVESTRCGTTSR